MAGELRRFWPLAAALSLGTGRGPVQPTVAQTAEALTERLPCTEVLVPNGSGARLTELLAEAPSWA